jgi:hypothetical protein
MLVYIFILFFFCILFSSLLSILSHPYAVSLHLASRKRHLPRRQQANAICDSPAITARNSPLLLELEAGLWNTKEGSQDALATSKNK